MSTHPILHHHANAAHAASHARSAPKAHAAHDGEAHGQGGFAAQLLRAQPAHDAKPADAKADPKTDASKPAKDDADQGGADAKGARDDKDPKDPQAAATPDGRPPAADPNAPPPWPPQAAPATTSLAAKPDADPDAADGVVDPFAALRKGKGAKEVGLAALGLGKDVGRSTGKDMGKDTGKDVGKDAKATDAAALQGKGSKSAGDFTAALGKAEGAGNGATGTRDAMAALLPPADPAAVQAGTVGASPNAVLDNPAAPAAPPPPAQATLPMTPQSPTFAPALGQQISLWLKDGIQHAEVQLSPMDLGPIRVKIEMAGAQTRVEMAADVPSTRDALQQALPQLADSLGQVGISLSGGSVSDQSTAQQQAQSQAFAAAGGGGGQGGRPGAGATRGSGGDAGGEEFAVASAARQAAQRRGLLDMYA